MSETNEEGFGAYLYRSITRPEPREIVLYEACDLCGYEQRETEMTHLPPHDTPICSRCHQWLLENLRTLAAFIKKFDA